ncbi:MAG: homocysteine S-methyltransferase family protein [Clostridia bacterium]|nr:homocysteine S-methyltransferase family protein [Clostridia bacterium]
MNFRDYLNKGLVFLDGGMGTLLQEKGLLPGQRPEEWNLSHPEVICEIHKSYFDAGSNVVCTNTFGANRLKFDRETLESILSAAVKNARKAQSETTNPEATFVALDIGPTGKLLRPLGDLDFEEAVEIFRETVQLGVRYGVDLIFIETMNAVDETRAALIAAKECSHLPVLVSNAYGENGCLLTGASPEAMVAILEGMGADALGANCSLGPKGLADVAKRLLKEASIPVLLKPNAGLPRTVKGNTVFDVGPEEFARELASLVKEGLRIVGGCCGTTPAHIHALKTALQGAVPLPLIKKTHSVIASQTHTVQFGKEPILIGERINPTGKKRFKEALRNHDMDYILSEGIRQEEKGVHALDVNVGLPEIDEKAMLCEAVCALQSVLNLPLQIDTADAGAMEAALRCYHGKALINSVNGKEESMAAIFPLLKKYGGVAVALTLDENGIPETAKGRVEIAKRILRTAERYGIEKKNLIFDPLAMTISTDSQSALCTLESIRRIKTELGCQTSLGVSNVSFGLPLREAINGTFFALALENGLDAAIMNPDSADMMKVFYAYRALKGLDEGCAELVAASESLLPASPSTAPSSPKPKRDVEETDLCRAIQKGLCDKAAELATVLLKELPPLEIIQGQIVPALDEVGEGFEKKRIFLPQLLMSAEAAGSAFEVIRQASQGEKPSEKRGTVVIATVKGDVHDIGKNILRLLLENYGFEVVDLGKDVATERIVETVIERNAPLLGLSALMTTTVPAMEETIREIRKIAPSCKVMVGGAVLTREYAERIGADFYAKDAMEGVRYAERIFKA